MIFAGVDIGSNAGRLLIATVFEKEGKIFSEKITLVRVPLRLGFDVFSKGYITSEKEEFLLRTFEAYDQLMKVYQPLDMFACGTAAIREARNNIEIIDRLKMELGIELHMIDGKKESEIISTAENSNMSKPHPYSLYIDVGGGSAEISWFHHDKLLKTRSFDIGTIRVLFDQVPLSEWDSLKDWLIELKLEDQPFNCICSGGNVNKLTKLFGSRDKNTLSYSQLVEGHEFLEGYSVEDRIEKMGLRADRADVIVPAAIIFKKIMKWGKIHNLFAPKIGLADGLVVDLFKKQTGKPTKFV